MKVTISKSFTFDAAHFVPCFPEGHKCRGMHGHTYEVEFILTGETSSGLLVDYQDIADLWHPIAALVDHKVLNEVPGLENPTTENLVAWLFEWVVDDKRPQMRVVRAALSKIRVHESSTTWCEISARDWMGGRGR